jgi:hypothetical protein
MHDLPAPIPDTLKTKSFRIPMAGAAPLPPGSTTAAALSDILADENPLPQDAPP